MHPATTLWPPEVCLGSTAVEAFQQCRTATSPVKRPGTAAVLFSQCAPHSFLSWPVQSSGYFIKARGPRFNGIFLKTIASKTPSCPSSRQKPFRESGYLGKLVGQKRTPQPRQRTGHTSAGHVVFCASSQLRRFLLLRPFVHP